MTASSKLTASRSALRFREREISFTVEGEIEGELDEPPGK